LPINGDGEKKAEKKPLISFPSNKRVKWWKFLLHSGRNKKEEKLKINFPFFLNKWCNLIFQIPFHLRKTRFMRFSDSILEYDMRFSESKQSGMRQIFHHRIILVTSNPNSISHCFPSKFA
jgi:hypothetical protein